MAPKLKWHDAKKKRPDHSGYVNVWFANGHVATVNYSHLWDCFNHYDFADGVDESDLEFDSEVMYWSESIVPAGVA